MRVSWIWALWICITPPGVSAQEISPPAREFVGPPAPAHLTIPATPLGTERLIQLETAQADLCNEEALKRPEVLLERYLHFVAKFEGDDPSTDRDNVLLSGARKRIEVLREWKPSAESAAESAHVTGDGPSAWLAEPPTRTLEDAPLCSWTPTASPTPEKPRVSPEQRKRAEYLIRQAHEHTNNRRGSSAASVLNDASLISKPDAMLSYNTGMEWRWLAIHSTVMVGPEKVIIVDAQTLEQYWQNALTDLKRACTLKPELAVAHFHVANIYQWLGNNEQAALYYRQSVSQGIKGEPLLHAREFLSKWDRVGNKEGG